MMAIRWRKTETDVRFSQAWLFLAEPGTALTPCPNFGVVSFLNSRVYPQLLCQILLQRPCGHKKGVVYGAYTTPCYVLVAMQGLEPRTLRI